MKTIAAGLLVMLLMFSAAGIASAQEGEAGDMMAKWMEMMSPNENHKVLDYFAGDWTATATMWMMGPDAPPQTYPEGEASFEWIFGGRFMKGTVKSPMGDGSFYEDVSYYGYDNFRHQYTAFGVSNLATNVTSSCGNYIEDENVFVFYNIMDEPLTGEVGKVTTHIYRLHSDDHFTMEVIDPVYGLENNVVAEFDYKRK